MNFANSQLFVKDKATETPHRVYYIQPSLALDDSIVRCQEYFLYTYTGVRLSVLLVSDEQGNAKALTSGTSDRTGFTFSCIYTNHLLIMPIW